MCSSLFSDCHEKIMLLFTSTLVLPHWQNQFWIRRSIIYLVSPTGEEKEKQSWRGRRRRINSAKAILLKPEASVEAIQGIRQRLPLQKNTLPWWYVFVTVGRVFCHACTSMTILWQNQDSHTCAVVEVFHDITKIIIMEVSTSMMINHASQKCFRQGWPTRGIHRNGTPLIYRVGFWIR